MRIINEYMVETDIYIEDVATGQRTPVVLKTYNKRITYLQEKVEEDKLPKFEFKIEGKEYSHRFTLLPYGEGVFMVNAYDEIRKFDKELQKVGYRIICNGTSKNVVKYKHPWTAWERTKALSVSPIEYSEWNEHYET